MVREIQERPLDERVRSWIAAGNVERATDELLRTLGPEVLGFLYGILDSEADADEVFGAASERVWRSLGRFQWRSTLRTWIYVIARNEAVRFLQGARRRHAGHVTPSALEKALVAVRATTRSTRKSEKRDRLLQLRAELPPDDRMLLVLRVDRDLAWEDIALTFLSEEQQADHEQVQREAARLRKRFQLVRKRLADRARQQGLLPK
jgi:RNA polymerase sigma-70 factor (ECF subfamily)